jgi:hypothetical protein
LFTGVWFHNETYVSIGEFTEDWVSLNPFLTQVITKIELEFHFAFLNQETKVFVGYFTL